MIAAAVCNLRDYATSVMTKRNFWDDGIYATFFLPGIWLGDMSSARLTAKLCSCQS